MYIILSHRQQFEEKHIIMYVLMILILFLVVEHITPIITYLERISSTDLGYENLEQVNPAPAEVLPNSPTSPPPSFPLAGNETTMNDKLPFPQSPSPTPTPEPPLKTPPIPKEPKLYERVGDGYYIPPKENPQIERNGSRQENDVMKNEYVYTDYNNFPLWDMTPESYEPGFSYMPPMKWYPTPAHPPVCVATKQCPVCPINTSGLATDLKEWHQSRRVMPPDNINTAFIRDKLNSGR
jgi:hypothetical protein